MQDTKSVASGVTAKSRFSKRSASVNANSDHYRAIKEFAKGQLSKLPYANHKDMMNGKDANPPDASSRAHSTRMHFKHPASRPAHGVRDAVNQTRRLGETGPKPKEADEKGGVCLNADCTRPAFKERLCKYHFA